jgi:hypothetical protein
MAWSDWQQTAPGKYQTNNLNTGSVGRNSFGLPNSPSIPVLPVSSNCSYTVYGVWKILDKNGGLNNPNQLSGTIPLYKQVMYAGQIFYTYSYGFPVYYVGRYASFNGVQRVDNSIEYGNQDMRCALGEIVYSFSPSERFLYLNWHKDSDSEIVFVTIFTEGLIGCDFTFPATRPPPKIYLGSAAPPPPPPKNMNCCDCNTIATIVEDKVLKSLKPSVEDLKDHIDRRSEELAIIHQKQLEAQEIDLRPIVKRLNEVERNLWNGILR